MPQSYYERIFDKVDICLIVVNQELKIIHANNKACLTIKQPREQIINRSCQEVFTNSNTFLNCIQKTIDDGCEYYIPRLLIKDGEGMVVPINISSFPIKDSDTDIDGAMVFFTNLVEAYPTHLINFQKMGLIASSTQMKEVFQLIETVAATDSSVLIYGQTGTGKELVANAIYKLSSRNSKPFIKVNCAALSDSLLESELFGHEKGAFTGAFEKRTGRFELADGGTLFLDEIAEISKSFQAKLLRVLQEGEFERVGSSKTIKVNVRIISATNKDLYDLVKQKTFREDLYYRINVFPITIPSLVERQEDIHLIIEHLISEFNIVFKKQVIDISEEALQALYKYHFPGNVRELRNIIEYAFIRSSVKVIHLQDLPGYVLQSIPPTDVPDDQLLKNTMEKDELNHILEVIDKCSCNKTMAAQVLGITRKTLYNKLNRHKIQ